ARRDSYIFRADDRDSLHDRTAEARLRGGDTLRGFPAVELQDVERRAIEHGGDRRIVGIDKNADKPDAGGHRGAQRSGTIGTDRARARRVEIQTEIGRAALDRCGNRRLTRNSADFRRDAHEPDMGTIRPRASWAAARSSSAVPTDLNKVISA